MMTLERKDTHLVLDPVAYRTSISHVNVNTEALDSQHCPN